MSWSIIINKKLFTDAAIPHDVRLRVDRSARQTESGHLDEDHDELSSGEAPEGEGSGESKEKPHGGGLSLGKILGCVFLVRKSNSSLH